VDGTVDQTVSMLNPGGFELESSMPDSNKQTGRIGAYTKWSRVADRTAATSEARAAFLDRFERQVDPDGTLTADERGRRAAYARKAYFGQLAIKSAQARRTAS
jgi:hypothetical protein